MARSAFMSSNFWGGNYVRPAVVIMPPSRIIILSLHLLENDSEWF
jgi:hypothetical protein